MVITIDLLEEMFVHAILFVQDVYGGKYPSHHSNTNQFVQNVEFYVGSASDYSLNPVCLGGPYM